MDGVRQETFKSINTVGERAFASSSNSECMTQALSEGCDLPISSVEDDTCSITSLNACCIAEGFRNDCLGNTAYFLRTYQVVKRMAVHPG